MREYGEVYFTRHQNPLFGEDATEVTIKGGPYFRFDPFYLHTISCCKPGKDEEIIIGPYTFVSVEQTIYYNLSREYVIKSYRFWRLLVWKAKAQFWAKLIKSRLIYTLMVWNLAKVEPGTIPDWSDIKWIEKFLQWRSSKKA